MLAEGTLKMEKTMKFGTCFRCGDIFERELGNKLCSACRNGVTRSKALMPKLNFRETQVVGLVSQAKLNKEIAYELHLTEGTIKEYLHRIFRKLGTSNRTELAVWALTNMPQLQNRYLG